MKKSFIKLLAAGLFAAFAVTSTLQAAPAEKKEGAKEENKASGYGFHGKLSAVDQNAKTISIEGKEKTRTFHVTGQTKIMKDGKPATLADAKVGDEVGGYTDKAADGKLELRSLRIGPKPEGSEKSEGKKKKE